MDNPKISKEMLKKLATKLSKMLAGKKPKKVDIEENMSVDELGLKEETIVKVEVDDNVKIEIEVIDGNRMSELMELKDKKAEEEFDNMIKEQFERMGLTDDFRRQFPEIDEFEGVVIPWIDDLDADDFIFLCKECRRLEEVLDDDNLLNYRVCRTQVDELSEEYRQSQKGGCCEVFDHIVTNPKNERKFSIGCNHDHFKPKVE